ncbi:MAG: hypothetical protein R3F31_21460 [Verrucomicrobiales bacterium]
MRPVRRHQVVGPGHGIDAASLKSDAEFSPGPDRLVKVLAASPPDSRYQVRSGDILVTAKSTETSLRCGQIAADWEQRPSLFLPQA